MPPARPQTALALVRCLRRLEVPGVLLPVYLMALRKRDQDLVDAITGIRARNNSCWMALLTLALDKDPEHARPLIAEIVSNDKRVQHYSEKLARA